MHFNKGLTEAEKEDNSWKKKLHDRLKKKKEALVLHLLTEEERRDCVYATKKVA